MLLQLARTVWGGTLVVVPRVLLDRFAGRSREFIRATRILGARHLAEALILSRSRRSAPPRWPVIIDVVHGVSMVLVAIRSQRFRRGALVDEAAAALFASWSEVERRRS